MEGKNDGLVSVSSAKWGRFLGEVEIDHNEQMNWNLFKDVRYFFRDLVVNLQEAEENKENL